MLLRRKDGTYQQWLPVLPSPAVVVARLQSASDPGEPTKCLLAQNAEPAGGVVVLEED